MAKYADLGHLPYYIYKLSLVELMARKVSHGSAFYKHNDPDQGRVQTA